MMMKRFLAVLSARNKEFLRDTSALAWNFMFPILVVLGFGFAFSKGNQNVFKVGIDSAIEAPAEFKKTEYVEFVPMQSLEEGLGKLRRHQYDMVVSGARYWLNQSSPKGYLLEKILMGSLSEGRAGEPTPSPKLKRETVEGKEIRYVDWLISGLLAMNMMFSALFGVGYTIVRYRKNGVLKRLKATPLNAFEFLFAQVVSRLLLIQFVSVVVFVRTDLIIHFQMLGSYLSLFLVMGLGAMCLISLGLLVASRIASEEFAGGLLNLISWPMMFLSGVWFSLEGAHPLVQKIAQIFPLTHVIDASRAIMTEGATLSQVSGHIIAMVVMTFVFLIAGAWTFKWE